jgi:hypothetical protein
MRAGSSYVTSLPTPELIKDDAVPGSSSFSMSGSQASLHGDRLAIHWDSIFTDDIDLSFSVKPPPARPVTPQIFVQGKQQTDPFPRKLRKSPRLDQLDIKSIPFPSKLSPLATPLLGIWRKYDSPMDTESPVSPIQTAKPHATKSLKRRSSMPNTSGLEEVSRFFL